MNSQENLMASTIPERYSGQKTNLKAIFRKIATLPPEDQAIMLRIMNRYITEATNRSYKTEPEALVKFIADENLIDGSSFLIDLGAGSGDLLEKLSPAYPDILMRGIDISPGFVENFNQNTKTPNASMRVGLIDLPFDESGDIDLMNLGGKNASAVSVLTLDRLLNPKALIENMARFNRAKILATLLPIVPEDDNPSRQGDEKIVYTRPENRIVPGRTAGEDREALLRVLKDIWRNPVDVANVPYTVYSSGDKQDYDLAVFYSRG